MTRTPVPSPARPRPIPPLRRKANIDDDISIEILAAGRTPFDVGAFDLVVALPQYALDVPYGDGGVVDYAASRQLKAQLA